MAVFHAVVVFGACVCEPPPPQSEMERAGLTGRGGGGGARRVWRGAGARVGAALSQDCQERALWLPRGTVVRSAYACLGVALTVPWCLQEWFPSISATIGDWYPERNVFQIGMALASGPRFALVVGGYWIMRHGLQQRRRSNALNVAALLVGLIRTVRHVPMLE
jgi:hypothetical protein